MGFFSTIHLKKISFVRLCGQKLCLFPPFSEGGFEQIRAGRVFPPFTLEMYLSALIPPLSSGTVFIALIRYSWVLVVFTKFRILVQHSTKWCGIKVNPSKTIRVGESPYGSNDPSSGDANEVRSSTTPIYTSLVLFPTNIFKNPGPARHQGLS